MNTSNKIEPVTARKPPNAGKGRPPGAQNKTTTLIKEAVIKAAEKAGGGDMVDYLARQAEENPGPFLALLGKVLPTQIEGKLQHGVADPINDLLAFIAENGRKITDHG
jgi:hypothetical protein